jgi:hypothetical protein
MTYSEFQKSFVHFYLYHKLIKPLGSEKAEEIIHSFYTACLEKIGERYFEYLERKGPDPDIITSAFPWDTTKQGHDYWSLVNHIIQHQ